MNLHPGLIRTIIALRLRRIAAERANIIWLVVMPLVFSFLMGQLMGNWSAPQDQRYTFIVYGAEAGGEAVRELLAPLQDHPDFELVVRDTTATRASIKRLLEQNRVSGALRIGSGFADSLARNLAPTIDFYHDAERGSSQRIRRAFEKTFAAAAVRMTARQLVDPVAALSDPGRAVAFDVASYDSLVAAPRVRLDTEVLGRSRYDDLQLTDSRQHSGPSYALMFILMFLLMSAKDLVFERQHRTLDRLRLAWPSTADIILGFFLSGMAVGLLQAGVLLAANNLLFGIDYGPSPGCLAVVMTLFVAVSSAAGLLLGALSRTGGQADGLGIVFGLGLPALGGLWWPLEVVPPFMQTLGRALPTGQAITVFHDMIGRGWGLAEAIPMLTGLVVWLVVLLAAAVLAFRRVVDPS